MHAGMPIWIWYKLREQLTDSLSNNQFIIRILGGYAWPALTVKYMVFTVQICHNLLQLTLSLLVRAKQKLPNNKFSFWGLPKRFHFNGIKDMIDHAQVKS